MVWLAVLRKFSPVFFSVSPLPMPMLLCPRQSARAHTDSKTEAPPTPFEQSVHGVCDVRCGAHDGVAMCWTMHWQVQYYRVTVHTFARRRYAQMRRKAGPGERGRVSAGGPRGAAAATARMCVSGRLGGGRTGT